MARTQTGTTSLTIDVPADFVLMRDACSYGYFLLAPNGWSPAQRTMTIVLALDDAGLRSPAVTAVIAQGEVADQRVTTTLWKRLAGTPLTVSLSKPLDATAQARVRSAITRMLRLDDPRWRITRPGAGVGRLMRSATLFEDVVKTITSCNVTWPGTVNMNRLLCTHYGPRDPATNLHAFPAPGTIARLRPANLRGRCRVGYRDARLVELARMFTRGQIDEFWLTNPANTDEHVRKHVLQWPGIGPYAAANLLQLLGRYGSLAIDSEAIRHGRDVLGFKGSPRSIAKHVEAHFAPFGQHKFRSYWFELRAAYESKAGPAWTWEPRAPKASAAIMRAKPAPRRTSTGKPASRPPAR
jgi:3-methyladenine DNA glycosylase/8-oxoguanine DNA glycosylase